MKKLLLIFLIPFVIKAQLINLFSSSPRTVITYADTAQTFYVDATSGNDSNDGLTELTPWKTISKVNSSSLDSVSTANGDTLSSSADLKGNLLFTIEVPSSFDGTEITIYTSRDGSNFKPVYNSDNEILKVTVTAGRKYYLIPANYYWIDRYIKIESNSAASGADKFYITKGKYFKT